MARRSRQRSSSSLDVERLVTIVERHGTIFGNNLHELALELRQRGVLGADDRGTKPARDCTIDPDRDLRIQCAIDQAVASGRLVQSLTDWGSVSIEAMPETVPVLMHAPAEHEQHFFGMERLPARLQGLVTNYQAEW